MVFWQCVVERALWVRAELQPPRFVEVSVRDAKWRVIRRCCNAATRQTDGSNGCVGYPPAMNLPYGQRHIDRAYSTEWRLGTTAATVG